MKFYFAGAESNTQDLQSAGVTRILTSYYNASEKKIVGLTNMFYDVFLDSGAFSAYTGGRKINIDDLITFIKKHHIRTYAGLDVIGDAEATKNNIAYMRNNGLKHVIPTFHHGEDMAYLKWYCENFGCVAIGGLVPIKMKKRILQRFLDSCFHTISEYPDVKIHGFGVGSKWIMERYPFYSVDATTWNVGAKFANICDEHTMTRRITKKNVRNNGTLHEIIAMCNGSTNQINIQRFLKLEQYITNLWTKRGIIWD